MDLNKDKIEPIRDAFGRALVKFAKIYPQVAVFSCDLFSATKTEEFKKKYPDRFFECGIAESNALSQAAGYAMEGGRPFVASFAHFLTAMYLPITQSIMQNEAPVVIVGSHPGLAIGEDGPTQMGLRDIAVMKVFPPIEIIEPVDSNETEQVVEYLAKTRNPAYLRIGRAPVPQLTSEDYKFRIGKGNVLREGNDAVIFATGYTVSTSLQAAEELKKEKGVDITIVNMSSIKPYDKELVLKLAKKTGNVFVVQDHYIHGGLGDFIARDLLENDIAARCKIWGVTDMAQTGSREELYAHYMLDKNGIKLKLLEFLKIK
jgi:transketolase